MRRDVPFVVLALLLVKTQARGPLCLDCLSVTTPRECTRVTECAQNEVCFGETTLLEDPRKMFSFGCRSTQNCLSGTTLRKRSEFRLCDSCCHGDLCNNNVCTDGTAPPAGIPCLECSGVLPAAGCSPLTYCEEGRVCYSQRQPHSTVSTMGCLPQKNSSTTIPKETTSRPIGITTAQPLVRDCWDVRTLLKKTVSGYYQVTLNGSNITVYCDMETDGGGWTVFQSRYNGTVSFNRTYDEYKRGFGNSFEFWLGNEKLHMFTSERSQTLRIDMCRFNGASHYAKYLAFYISPASDIYRLNLMSYSGDAGDALLAVNKYGTHNGQYFTAQAMDKVGVSENCAKLYSSGWWFDHCYMANLNGVYGEQLGLHGVNWNTLSGSPSLKRTQMKFRPRFAKSSMGKDFVCT